MLGNKVKSYNSKIEVIELKDIGYAPQIEDFGKFRKALEGTIEKKWIKLKFTLLRIHLL